MCVFSNTAAYFRQEYEDFINSAEHGVVLFSLGCTGFSAKDFPAEVTSSFISAFAA
jgi:hypothetical protein